jgi:tRNA modification GTPase
VILSKKKKISEMSLLNQDTIVAIATAHGVGSISIIRLSGDDALSIAQKIVKKELTPRYAHLCKIYDGDDFIDEAIVIYFKAPFSFSGEDIVEIQCHGGIMLSKMIQQLCLKHNARLAKAGEFSKRAFLNSKMDLSKVESISSLIFAKDEQMVKLIANNLKGDLGDFVDNTREQLINILAYSEVSIDYSEEDLPVHIIDDMKDKLSIILQHLNNIYVSSKKRLTLLDGHKIAIVGKPNVGKSSLLNELLEYNRAIVSDEAGTTRDTIEEHIMINNKLVKLIDTAGIRISDNDIETQGIDKSKLSIKEADIIIALFDGSCDIDKEDKEILSLIKQYENTKYIIKTLSKSDKNQISDIKYDVKISSKNKNIKDLLSIIEDILSKDSSYDDVILTSQRQINIIQNCISNINESLSFLEKEELEFFSYHINQTIEEISSITKSYEYSELLDEIFGNFCLGK